MATTPPWYAGSAVTAAALDMLIPQYAVLAADTPSNGTTSAQAILSFLTVTPGQYRLNGQVNYEGGQNAGAVILSFHAGGSLAVSSMQVDMWNYTLTGTSPASVVLAFSFGTLAGTFTSGTMTSGGSFAFTFDGIINVSVAGGLSVDVAQSIAADTFITRANSYARLETVL